MKGAGVKTPAQMRIYVYHDEDKKFLEKAQGAACGGTQLSFGTGEENVYNSRSWKSREGICAHKA